MKLFETNVEKNILKYYKPKKFLTILMINILTTEDILFSLLHRYQISLEEIMKASDFSFDDFDGLHYKCNKKSLTRCGSYIDSPKWIKMDKKSNSKPKK